MKERIKQVSGSQQFSQQHVRSIPLGSSSRCCSSEHWRMLARPNRAIGFCQQRRLPCRTPMQLRMPRPGCLHMNQYLAHEVRADTDWLYKQHSTYVLRKHRASLSSNRIRIKTELNTIKIAIEQEAIAINEIGLLLSSSGHVGLIDSHKLMSTFCPIDRNSVVMLPG